MIGQLGNRISFQLARIAITIAFVVGMAFAVGQIYIDFNEDQENQHNNLVEVISFLKPSLTRAIVNENKQVVDEIVEGLVSYDYIIAANIQDPNNRQISSTVITQMENRGTRWLTRLFYPEVMETTIDLPTSDGGSAGKLVLVVDYDIYLSAFYERALITLISGFIYTFTLVLLLIAIINNILSKPLRKMASQLERIDPAKPVVKAIEVADSDRNNELGELAGSLNMMMGAINTLMEEQEDAQKRLSIARDELEFRVNDRTAELKHEIRERLRAEELLKEANIKLEDRVEGRTKELREEIARHKTTLVELSEMKEEADSANRAKTSFLANMSHELRTPLNAIVGFTTIMDDEMFGPVGNERYKQYVKDIQDSGTHLSEILGNILDLAKVEAGELNLNEEQVDVAKMVDSCAKMFVVMSAEAGIDICQDVPDDLPLLLADELRVKQIIINLVSNSLKFTNEGGKITIGGEINDNGGVTICVADTGEGIPKDELEKVLEPFAQVESTFERTYQGVGLGLSLSKSLAELHGGILWVESEVDEGTKVFIEFPKFRTVKKVEQA